MTTPTQERLMTPDEVEAGVAARLAAYTRGQRRGPLTGDVHLWAYSAALAGWRASELRLAEAESQLGSDAELLFQAGCVFALNEDDTPAKRMFERAKKLGHKDADEQLAALAHDKAKDAQVPRSLGGPQRRW